MTRILRGDHCRCSGCNEYFNSTAAFDKHRRGYYGLYRRCLSVDEMLSIGMARNADGWWVTARVQMAPAYLHGNSTGRDREGAAT